MWFGLGLCLWLELGLRLELGLWVKGRVHVMNSVRGMGKDYG